MSSIPSTKDYDKYRQEIENASSGDLRVIALKLLRENFQLKLNLTKAKLAEEQIIYVVKTLDRSVAYLAMKCEPKNLGILLATNVVNFLESFFIAYKQIEALCDYQFEEKNTHDIICEIYVSLSDVCAVLKQKQSIIRRIQFKYENGEDETEASELSDVSSCFNQSDVERFLNRRKRYSRNLEADAETSELSDSSRSSLANHYNRRKKKNIRRKSRKRTNLSENENRRTKRRRISVNSANERLNPSQKHDGHQMDSETETFQECAGKVNAKISSSEVIGAKGRKRTNTPFSSKDVKEIENKGGRRRVNSKTSHDEMNNEELPLSKSSQNVEKEPRGVGQRIKDDLVLIKNKVQLKKFNITKKLVVKLTDYVKGCSKNVDANECIEAISSQEEAPVTESNADSARSREANSSRESDEYEILDEVEDDNNDKENNSELENNEKDLPNNVGNESAKSCVSDSENSNDEINSDAIFNDEAKDEEIDKTSSKSNDDVDDEMEVEEDDDDDDDERGEDSENKDSDSESERSSESPKKKSTYGKKGPRTPPSPFPYCGPGPRTPEGPGPGNDTSDSEDMYYSSVYEK